MSRQNKWWEHEQPVETRVSNVLIRQYPQSGVLQFQNWVESPNYTGPTKPVTIHLDKLTLEQGQQIADLVQGAVDSEQDFRPAPAKVNGKGAKRPARTVPTDKAKRHLTRV